MSSPATACPPLMWKLPILSREIGMLFAPLIHPDDPKSSVITNESAGLSRSKSCRIFFTTRAQHRFEKPGQGKREAFEPTIFITICPKTNCDSPRYSADSHYT